MLLLLLGCWQTWKTESVEDCEDPPTWFADEDEDNSGSAAYTLVSCSQPEGYVAEGGDCDDADGSRHPGAPELCDGVDQDCDGEIDEDGDGVVYKDGDGDGWGDDDQTAAGCTPPSGYVLEGGDCDDADPLVYPGREESCDGADEDCDGAVDEEPSDGQTWYVDGDNDGWGDEPVVACEQPAGSVDQDGDCNDAGSAIHPGATEICENGIDDNCDGLATPCSWDGTYDAIDADTWAYGLDPDSYHGWSIDFGDLDGNGQGELIIASLGASPTISLLEYPFSDSISLQAEAGQITGPPNSTAGWSMTVLDRNGDGHDDLAVGDGQGRLYMLQGPLASGNLQTAWSFQHEGIGYSLDSGDVDGDGVDELCSGAPTASGGAGEVLWFGNPSDPGRVLGELANDSLGDACLLADLDGDGLDGLVGSAARGGMFFVFDDAPSGFVSATDADVRVRGELAFGYVLAKGDLDGDGREDLLVGSPLEDNAGTGSGSTYLFTDVSGATSPSHAQARYDGPTPNDDSGQGISIGDVDADGVMDLLIGAPGDANDRGSARLLLAPGTAGVVDLGDDSSATFDGFLDDSYFGSRSLLVDLDGDGDADPVLSAPYEDSSSGGVWLWLSPGL